MPDVIYQKPTLNAEGENRIELSAREQLALRDELSTQIIQHKISGLSQELIYAIFHKTIRYNKREDDLNGVCLSNLTSTGSRSDYVNKHVTELIADSVLIARLGTHGRILSINFNFAQWGKSVEYNRENGGLVSDPETLLKTLDIPEELEELEELEEFEEESSSHAPRGNSVSNASALQDKGTEPRGSASGLHSHEACGNEGLVIENRATEPLSASSLSALLADNIPLNLAALITEDLIKQGLQKLLDMVINLLKNNPIIENLIDLLKIQIPPENSRETPSPSPTNAEIFQSPASDRAETAPMPTRQAENTDQTRQHLDSEQATLELCPLSDAKAEAQEAPKTAQEPTQDQNQENTAIDYDTLIFPVELKPYEQNQIKNILEKEAISDLDGVQSVLNSMSSRYQAGLEAIKSPIAYFRSLLKSVQQGDFDSSYAEIYQQQRTEHRQQEKTQTEQQDRRLYLDKYNEAKNKYELLKLFAQNTGISLREEAKERKWLALIEEMGFDLDINVI